MGTEPYPLSMPSNLLKLAELLDTNVHEIYRLAKKRDVEIGATLDQQEKGEKTAEEMIE